MPWGCCGFKLVNEHLSCPVLLMTWIPPPLADAEPAPTITSGIPSASISATAGLLAPDTVPVERDQGARALRAMIAAARSYEGSGRHYAIFPEGTRVPHGTAPPLQAGFAGLYKLLALPVVPVAIDSGPLYHRRWKRPG